MKFNIFNYSQQGALSLKLDLKDLLILDWFQTFMPQMNKIIYEEEQYYWISYEKVLSDIPIIEITTEKGLYKRLQNLCEIGILKHYTSRTSGGCYSYYLITDMIKILISPESSFAESRKFLCRVPKVPLQSPESSEQKDSSIINSSIINNCILHAEQDNLLKNGNIVNPELENFAEKPSLNKKIESVPCLSPEAFKDFWNFSLLRPAPIVGFDVEFKKFISYWGKINSDKKRSKYNNNWQNYLKEWVTHDWNINSNKQKCSDNTMTYIAFDCFVPCVEIFIKQPEIAQFNKLLPDEIMRSLGEAVYYAFFQQVFIFKYDLNQKTIKVNLVCHSKKILNAIKMHYWQKFTKIIKFILQKDNLEIQIDLSLPTEGECRKIKLIY